MLSHVEVSTDEQQEVIARYEKQQAERSARIAAVEKEDVGEKTVMKKSKEALSWGSEKRPISVENDEATDEGKPREAQRPGMTLRSRSLASSTAGQKTTGKRRMAGVKPKDESSDEPTAKKQRGGLRSAR